MSEQGVDQIRRLHERTYTQENYPAVREAFFANFHPELTYHTREDEPDSATLITQRL